MNERAYEPRHKMSKAFFEVHEALQDLSPEEARRVLRAYATMLEPDDVPNEREDEP